jgi:hypothetical protein
LIFCVNLEILRKDHNKTFGDKRLSDDQRTSQQFLEVCFSDLSSAFFGVRDVLAQPTRCCDEGIADHCFGIFQIELKLGSSQVLTEEDRNDHHAFHHGIPHLSLVVPLVFLPSFPLCNLVFQSCLLLYRFLCKLCGVEATSFYGLVADHIWDPLGVCDNPKLVDDRYHRMDGI